MTKLLRTTTCLLKKQQRRKAANYHPRRKKARLSDIIIDSDIDTTDTKSQCTFTTFIQKKYI